MKKKIQEKQTKNTQKNTAIGNIDYIPGEIFIETYEEYKGYINNEEYYYKKNELYSSKEEQELAYDDLVSFISHVEPDYNQNNLSLEEIKTQIKGKRGILTITEIKNYKEGIKRKLRNRKNHTDYYNEFKNFYEEAKTTIKNAGGHLENNYQKYLDPNNKDNLEYIMYSKVRKEINGYIKEALQKRKEKQDKITKQLETRGLSIFTFVRQKQLISVNDLTMEDLQEIEKYINLVDKINEKLKIINTNFINLLAQLKLNIEKIKLKELEIINTNIEEYLIKENLEREIAK